MNDNLVSAIKSEDLRDSTAYLLFYMRRDIRYTSVKDMHQNMYSLSGKEKKEGYSEEDFEKLMNAPLQTAKSFNGKKELSQKSTSSDCTIS